MAVFGGFQVVVPFIAAADLSTYQAKAVMVGAADGTVVPSSGNAAQRAIGILKNDPTSGHGAGVVMLGAAKCLLGGTVTRGTQISHDSSAFVIAATSGLVVLGMALESGVAGDVIDAFIGIGAGLGTV